MGKAKTITVQSRYTSKMKDKKKISDEDINKLKGDENTLKREGFPDADVKWSPAHDRRKMKMSELKLDDDLIEAFIKLKPGELEKIKKGVAGIGDEKMKNIIAIINNEEDVTNLGVDIMNKKKRTSLKY
ncbi:MAG: hypothetical protein GY760_09305 [Deltaproteobacteria bacterium]|nr:hypothetical protein [Deltaproteobacteria bacterium]